MTDLSHFDLADARKGARDLAEARRAARRDYEKYGKQEAQAEHDYRVTKASAFAAKKLQNETATGAEIHANATAAPAKLARDTAHVLAKSAEQRIAELERDAAFLNRICEWSMKLEGLPQPQWSREAA